MPSRHRSLGPPFLRISRGKLSQRLASLNFCLPLFLLFIYSFVISENIKSTKYILHVGRHETKRRTANCRTQKVHSSFSACQDRTNFSLYSYNFISVDTQFIASKALGFFLISLYYPCSKKHAKCVTLEKFVICEATLLKILGWPYKNNYSQNTLSHCWVSFVFIIFCICPLELDTYNLVWKSKNLLLGVLEVWGTHLRTSTKISVILCMMTWRVFWWNSVNLEEEHWGNGKAEEVWGYIVFFWPWALETCWACS